MTMTEHLLVAMFIGFACGVNVTLVACAIARDHLFDRPKDDKDSA